MCGICGYVGPGDIGLLKDMTKVVYHRGPDNTDHYVGKSAGLGHSRLSIIDLSSDAHQPMCNEEGNIWISYNGEIYNFYDIREKLSRLGHSFKSSSDTEVIIHAYEQYGDECVYMFNGMFAFAIWDDSRGRLLLARDRFGIKPLHYIQCDGIFLFASEIKSILQHPDVKRKVDLQSFHNFINLRYVPGPDTMFQGVKRLQPGHILSYKGNKASIRRYWTPRIRETKKSLGYFVKKTAKLIEESVKRQLVADVPLGMCLSGGIDSSALVALASRHSENPLNTFCMGFGDPQDEIEDARLVAQEFGTNHMECVMDDTLIRDYPLMIWHADEPKRNLYPYYIYHLASEKVRTVLGGLGGDELFGGYIFKYNYMDRVQKIRRRMNRAKLSDIQKAATKTLKFQTEYGSMIDDEHLDYLDMLRYVDSDVDLYLITQTLDRVFNSEYLERIYGSDLIRSRPQRVSNIYRTFFTGKGKLINKVLIADFSVKMVDDFLLVDDRMSMANSIESRVPFLDNALVDLSFSMPARLKTHDPNGKHIFRLAMKESLPKKVISKKKRGFASSTYNTYTRELRECAESLLPGGKLVSKRLVKKNYVEKVLKEVANPRLRMHYDVIWNLFTAEIWYNMFIEGDPCKPKLKLDCLT